MKMQGIFSLSSRSFSADIAVDRECLQPEVKIHEKKWCSRRGESAPLLACRLWFLDASASARRPAPYLLFLPTFHRMRSATPVTIMGNLAGQQAVWNASMAPCTMFFQFNDRGRGPKTTSILTLDAKGYPSCRNVSGNDYLKSPVSEDYSLKAGTARWKKRFPKKAKSRSSRPQSMRRSTERPPSSVLSPCRARNGGQNCFVAGRRGPR